MNSLSPTSLPPPEEVEPVFLEGAAEEGGVGSGRFLVLGVGQGGHFFGFLPQPALVHGQLQKALRVLHLADDAHQLVRHQIHHLDSQPSGGVGWGGWRSLRMLNFLFFLFFWGSRADPATRSHIQMKMMRELRVRLFSIFSIF